MDSNSNHQQLISNLIINNHQLLKVGNRITLPAVAKINTRLILLGKDTTGYHQLFSYFQLINLQDNITFTIKDKCLVAQMNINFFSDNLLLQHQQQNSNNNLIIQAANKLLALLDPKEEVFAVDIFLQKNIPLGGGLGGGSSNAATTILFLNKLWNLNLPLSKLLAIALELGADVPIFVYGKSTYAAGYGEIFISNIKSQQDQINNKLQLVIPNIHITTKDIFTYSTIKQHYIMQEKINKQTALAYIKEHSQQLLSLPANSLTTIVKQYNHEFNQLENFLNQKHRYLMSGSGSCLFSIDSLINNQQLQQQFPNLPNIKQITVDPLTDNPVQQIIAHLQLAD